MTNNKPYISLVVAGRNDNYNGDFTQRLQLSISWLSFLVQKHQLPFELVLVNYNPIPDQPDLGELLDWPEDNTYLSIKIVDVPASFHKKYHDPEIRKSVPLYEFIAKNIGIVRTKGEFILCTNADILLSEALFIFLATRPLKKGHVYRCDRVDFSPVTEKVNFKELESYIRKNVHLFMMKGGFIPTLSKPRALNTRLSLLRMFNKIRLYYYRTFLYLPIIRSLPFFTRVDAKLLFTFTYHCQASGDFCLMHRSDWGKIKGYLEDTWTNVHVDSLCLVAAVTAGVQQIELPYPVYHQDHQKRFDYDGYSVENRMGKRFLSDVNKMLKTGKPIVNDSENWGLKNEKLSERIMD
ncbi:MAG: hypothetical protein AAF502_15660 [Bacteroidota bacterium]